MEEKRECYLYTLEGDGMHVCKGTYFYRHYRDGYQEEEFKTENGESVYCDYGYGGEPTLIPEYVFRDERDDESARDEFTQEIIKAIRDLSEQLSWLDKPVHVEEEQGAE